MATVKINDVKPGDTLVADGGFTCMPSGPRVVGADVDGRLFVPCADGQHFLNGQTDGGAALIGFTRAD